MRGQPSRRMIGVELAAAGDWGAGPSGAGGPAGSLTGSPSGTVASGEDVRLTGSLPPAKALGRFGSQSRLGTGVWRTVEKRRPSGQAGSPSPCR